MMLSRCSVRHDNFTATPVRPAVVPPPSVAVAMPVQANVADWTDLTGQFSAVDKIELRAQVGGVLTEIHFKDGQLVHKGDLLFVIDPRPYEIKLAQANAQLQTAKARVAFANNQLSRAQSLRRNEFATQRRSKRRTPGASVKRLALTTSDLAVRRANPPNDFVRRELQRHSR